MAAQAAIRARVKALMLRQSAYRFSELARNSAPASIKRANPCAAFFAGWLDFPSSFS